MTTRVNRSSFTVDLLVLTALTSELAVLVEKRKGDGSRWSLPWSIPIRAETMAAVATRLSTAAIGTRPAWMEQLGAYGDGRRHPSSSALSVGYLAAIPHETAVLERGFHWFPVRDLPPISPRHRVMVDEGIRAVKLAIDHTPVAFRLLPEKFTLTELQQMYELLLGKHLHKASFRRTLQAAAIAEPTDEWRSEGRGRPAQLYRYGPQRRRKSAPGLRFDLIAAGSV